MRGNYIALVLPNSVSVSYIIKV